MHDRVPCSFTRGVIQGFEIENEAARLKDPEQYDKQHGGHEGELHHGLTP